MIRFLRLFNAFRDLEESLEGCQASRVQWQAKATTAEEALRLEIREHQSTQELLESAETTVQVEQARRISAAAIASERREEIERMIDTNRILRDDLKSSSAERLRSLDTLNLKLMESKVPEQPVDFSQHHGPVTKLRTSIVDDIRRKHREIDAAILAQAKNGFSNRRTMNVSGTTTVVPTLADIEKTELSKPDSPDTAAS